jgi:hypothetical protein
MIPTFLAPLLLLAAAHTVHHDACRVAFAIPSNWRADFKPLHDDDSDRACAVGLMPRDWPKVITTSRWDMADLPLRMVIYKPDTPFDDAVDDSGFEHDGERFGIPGGYGSFADAKPVSISPWRGLRADAFSRGFIRDEALLKPDESRVYSSSITTIIVKSPAGRVVAFECPGGTPDEPIDCEGVIVRIVRTLAFR